MPGGRPSKYPDIIKKWGKDLERLFGLGVNEEDICIILNISRSTFSEWKNDKKNKSKLTDIIKKGKWKYDKPVIESLKRRSEGYDRVEETWELRLDSEGNEIMTLVKKVTKHVPPSDTAIIYWLNNRREEWSNEGYRGKKNEDDELTFEGWK